MLDDPNMAQMMNEALNNPQMVDMLINNIPALRNNPQAREIIRSPMFREMLTNPQAIRQAAQMQRMMGGMGGGGGANAFPAPGVTDSTPGGGAANNPPANPFAGLMGGGGGGDPFAALGGQGGAGGNPFASMFQPGQTPAQTPPAPGSAGQTSPPVGEQANPFAALLGGGGAPGANPFMPGMPPMTNEQMQQAMQFLQGTGGGAGFGNMFGGGAGAGAAASPPPPADTRPPEERWEAELRQLNDMGFFDFDANVAALRRSGGSVQGAIEQLLS